MARSIYLADPDGLGLEIGVELPERVKSIRWLSTEQQPEIVDAKGRFRQGLEPLDIDAVLAKLPPDEPEIAGMDHYTLRFDAPESLARRSRGSARPRSAATASTSLATRRGTRSR